MLRNPQVNIRDNITLKKINFRNYLYTYMQKCLIKYHFGLGPTSIRAFKAMRK
jgi:hypothetical protein